MNAPDPVERKLCTVCAVETQWVRFGDEDPWCDDCGYSEAMLEPEDNPGGCPKHPDATHESGYGLAGGGIGVYSVCNECGAVFNKVEDVF